MEFDDFPTLEWQIYRFCLTQSQTSQDIKYTANIAAKVPMEQEQSPTRYSTQKHGS